MKHPLPSLLNSAAMVCALLLALSPLSCSSCSGTAGSRSAADAAGIPSRQKGKEEYVRGVFCSYAPEYAGGFEILGRQGFASRTIRVKAAWQGADSTASEVFISRNGENAPSGFSGQVVREKAERIAVMSSSYIAMLDLLGETDKVKAVSGMQYITNPYILGHQDEVEDIGYEGAADFEKLVKAGPDLVLLYGISASNTMESRLRSLGIPHMYMGEYLEPSALGRAEWLVAIGEITGRREKAEKIFSGIAERYRDLKSRIPENAERPLVMLNVPYGDTWYMSPSRSGIAEMIRDAGGQYIYRTNDTNRSLPVDMEEAYLLASEADFWLNTGQIGSLGELVRAYPQFKAVKSITGKRVYNCDKRLNPHGGNDFWESGQTRPDLVLEDLIRIFHPEVLESGGGFHYYRKLE